MRTRSIPTDDATAADTKLTSVDWRRAEGAHERYKALLEVKLRAKARYDSRVERES
jgi:hypothetical protein